MHDCRYYLPYLFLIWKKIGGDYLICSMNFLVPFIHDTD